MKALRPSPFLVAAVTATAAVALLAGCSSPASKPTATKTVTASPTASATASPTPSASVDPNAPQGQCADSALKIAVTPQAGGGAAGSVYYSVVFTNSGSTSCALEGYPGVSVVDSSGAQLGKAATFAGSSPVVRELAPGGSVYATLKKVDIGSGGSPLDGCTVVNGTGWSVYAPHSFARVIVPSSSAVAACSPGPVFMTITAPVAPGTGA